MTNKEKFEKKLSEITHKLPAGSKLLIVSKTRPQSDIEIYYALGHRDFGENRVQELEEKALALKDKCPEIRWHMIGHLQSNKINALFKIPHLYAIHSVHDRDLLDQLIKAQGKLSSPVNIFLQYNTSKEAEKSGFETYTDLKMAANALIKNEKLNLAGVMTMGTLRTDHFEAEARRCFEELNVEKCKLEAEYGVRLETSMGMSQDYQIALEEKSNWIRLGTMMFT